VISEFDIGKYLDNDTKTWAKNNPRKARLLCFPICCMLPFFAVYFLFKEGALMMNE